MSMLPESKRILTDRFRSEGIPVALIEAFQKVPRELFLPENLREQAYLDQPLHIGYEQTISQPTTVMNMLTLLMLSSKMSVLEIGSGSGYVCALLAELGCTVTGVELIPELTVRASKALGLAGLDSKVRLHAADGSGGWEDGAPYDRILISAACEDVPRHLFMQLKDDGVMVAPVGLIEQRMIACRKKSESEIVEEDHGAYVFVPLRGSHGQ